MARQRKLSPERKAFINSLLEHYQPSDANDVQDLAVFYGAADFGKAAHEKRWTENICR